MKFILHTLDKLKTQILSFWHKYMLGYGKSMKDGYVHNAFSPLVWFVIFLIIPYLVQAYKRVV